MANCGIPPVNDKLISDTPADAKSFALAKKAVRACSDLSSSRAVKSNFENAGFAVSTMQVELKNGAAIERLLISSPNKDVSIRYLGNKCYVGLEQMTPNQSFQLAKIWADAHDAKPNSAYGDGLSDHVAGAWRRFFSEPPRLPVKATYHHRVYVAAYKTWPHGPYAPQRNTAFPIEPFPNVPGAAVMLSHIADCSTYISTMPHSGTCPGADYRPR